MENNLTQQPNIDLEKLKSAKEELEATCKKYNIALVPVVVHQGDRTFSSVEIMPITHESQQSSANQQVEEVSKAE
jgi:hypothetical protein